VSEFDRRPDELSSRIEGQPPSSAEQHRSRNRNMAALLAGVVATVLVTVFALVFAFEALVQHPQVR
jgi:hypothetical protein